MKAYMVSSQKCIVPFEDHPRDCLIASRKLREFQESVLKSLDIELVVVEESQVNEFEEQVIFTDSLYFNEDLLLEFISRSWESGRNTVCAVKPGVFTLRTVVATQDVVMHDDCVEYSLYYVPAGGSKKEIVPVVIDYDQFHENLPMPEQMLGTPGYDIPLPDKLVIQIDHWTNLWAANIAALLAPAAVLMKTPRWKLLGKALKAGSLNQWKVVSKMNVIGRNCDIHPTAYVEGSVLGDNVTIGAGSVIRECSLADNVSVENNATLNFSVIGEGSYIADCSRIRYSVIYPNTFYGFSTLSCQVLGRNCFIGDGVSLTDYRLDGKCISVLKNGRVVDTGNRVLGSCIGHDSYLSAGTIIAPGRTVPNGTRIVPEYTRVIQKINPDGTIPDYRQVKISADKKSAAA